MGAADVNGDGFVDMAELPALVFPKAHDHVMHVVVQDSHRQKDANKDGTLTKQEFQEGVFGGELDEASAEVADADFAKLDQNGDGLLDHEELLVWESGRFHTEE